MRAPHAISCLHTGPTDITDIPASSSSSAAPECLSRKTSILISSFVVFMPDHQLALAAFPTPRAPRPSVGVDMVPDGGACTKVPRLDEAQGCLFIYLWCGVSVRSHCNRYSGRRHHPPPHLHSHIPLPISPVGPIVAACLGPPPWFLCTLP